MEQSLLIWWQPIIVGSIVLAATAYLVRQSWRTWFSAKKGCTGGCGCVTKTNVMPASTLVSVDELTQRLRGKT